MQIVRQMEVDDLKQVMIIENANFSMPWTEKGFLTFLLRHDTLFLVAEEESEILGYIGVITVLDEGDITNVAVKQSRQREGLGNLLVSSLLRLADELGIKTMHLEVRASNEQALSLYKRNGFEAIGTRHNYYESPTEDAITMYQKISI
jgi:ribosomal-protein-alanine acetyltransferase